MARTCCIRLWFEYRSLAAGVPNRFGLQAFRGRGTVALPYRWDPKSQCRPETISSATRRKLETDSAQHAAIDLQGNAVMSAIFKTEPSDSLQFRDLDQVMHDAQLRRTAELGGWLKQYLENRRQARLQKPASLPAPGMARPAT